MSGFTGTQREGYVRPPLVAREPTPRWVSVWAFRLVALLLLALLVLAVATIVKNLVNTEQSPTFGGLHSITSVSLG